MKIVGGNHYDYYDCIQKVVIDSDDLWIRKPVKKDELKEKIKVPCFYFYRGEYTDRTKIAGKTIGFCGKIYPVLDFSYTENEKQHHHFCYNEEDVHKFIKFRYKEKFVKEYEKPVSKKKYAFNKDYFNYHPTLKTKRDVCLFFEEYKKIQNKFENVFTDNKCPVFLVEYEQQVKKITYNCDNLKDFEFYRVFDPFTAYQEIAMFMSRFARPIREAPKIDDEIMSEIKGFDKWSFRKMPED